MSKVPDKEYELGHQLESSDQKACNRTSSTVGAVFSIVCIMAGMGTLGLPKTVAQSGWVGVGFILVMASVAFYTGGLLVDCLYFNPERRLANYPEVGLAAFGRPGMRFVQVFHYADMLGAACLFIMLAGINAQIIGQYFHCEREIGFWIALCGLLILVPYAGFKSMRQVSYMAVFGVSATIVTVITAVTLGLVNPPNYSPKHEPVNWDRIPVTLASISFTFGGNVVYPHIEASMRKPTQWRLALGSALGVVTAMYLIISVVCYHVYGEEAQAPIMLSLPPGIPNLCITILITLQVISATPILLCSFSLEIESLFNLESLNSSPTKELMFRMGSRTLIVGILTVIASFVPFFGSFMSLIGAFAISMMVFILPIVCHLRLFGMRSRPVWELPLMAVILVIAITSCVLGSISAVKDIYSKFIKN